MKFVKSWVVGAITTAVIALNGKYGIHLSPEAIVSIALIGLSLIFKHWHLDALAMKLGIEDEQPVAPAGGAAAVKLLFVVLALGILLGGCRHVDAVAVAEFQKDDAAIMSELSKYVSADLALGKAPAVSQRQLEEHNARALADPRSIDPTEEQLLMGALLAYISGDPKASDGLKKAWGGVVHGHLDLFTSVHR